MFAKSWNVLTTKSAKTGHIPRLAALDDLVGNQVHFVHVCHTYIWCTCTSAWKLAPLKHYKLKTYYIDFEIWKQNQGKGQTLNFNKRSHWKILNKDNLELPI